MYHHYKRKREEEDIIFEKINTYCENNINNINLLNNIKNLPISIKLKENEIKNNMTPRIEKIFTGIYNQKKWLKIYGKLEKCIYMKLKNINSDNFKLLRDKLIQIFNHIIEKYNLNIGVNKKLILDKYVKDQKYMLYLFFNYKENINNIDEQIIINTLIYIIKIFLDHYNIKYDEIYNINNNLEIENDDINYNNNNEYLKDGFVVSDEDEDYDEDYDEDINEEDYDEDINEEDYNEDINEEDYDEDINEEDYDEDINEKNYDKDINNIFIKKYSKKIIEENKEYLQNISINKINSLLDDFINDLKNKIKKFIN